jgi:cell shape-determining protein MreC
MMNSYQRNEGRRRLFAASVLVIFLFVADILSGGKIRNEIRAGAAVVSRLGGGIVSSIAGSGVFASKRALQAQNQSLAEEVSQLEERAAAYDVAQQENAQLQAIVHLAQTTPGMTAPVVSSLLASPYGTFTIGAGSLDGIAMNDLVQTEDGFVVGRVSDVGSHTALVTELFAPGASIDAIVDGTSVSVEGDGGGNAHTQVPRGLSIVPGDPVVAPSLGQRAVGIVGNVASSSASASQDISIRLPTNLLSLQFVYVASD